jgi:cytochrome c1
MMIPVLALLVACGGQQSGGDSENQATTLPDKAKPKYGKIQHVDVGPIDATMVKAGTEVFDTKCTACHKLDERYVGPSLGAVTKRRTPEYVMNMILDTETMIDNDDTVKCLLQEYLLRMPNQSVEEKDARNVLEYLRSEGEKRSL